MTYIHARIIAWCTYIMCIAAGLAVWLVDAIPHWAKWIIGAIVIGVVPGIGELFVKKSQFEARQQELRTEFETMLSSGHQENRSDE